MGSRTADVWLLLALVPCAQMVWRVLSCLAALVLTASVSSVSALAPYRVRVPGRNAAMWAHRYGSRKTDRAYDMDADSDGHLYVTGQVTGPEVFPINLPATSILMAGAGGSGGEGGRFHVQRPVNTSEVDFDNADAFVAKLDPNGTVRGRSGSARS
jgi:hypothetical protein